MASVHPPKSGSGSKAALGTGVARLRILVVSFSALALLSVLTAMIAPRLAGGQERGSQANPDAPRYELAARVNLPHGFIREAAWLDDDSYIALVLSPDGAAVWKMGYSEPSRLKFMSSSFIEERVCPAQFASRLTWVVSPCKRYICFLWFTDSGSREWALVDIGSAPEFKLKKFTPPAGMQVCKAQFSPDDRYLVLVHDATRAESPVSVLVLDLEQGQESWRIGTHELNFVSELWWGGAVFDAPRFCCAASLCEGKFYEDPGLAVCEITAKNISFTPQQNSLLCGAEALWGKVSCFANTKDPGAKFFLHASIPGERPEGQIPLSASPVSAQMLPVPGLVLLGNTLDYITNQLWLVDVLRGDKSQVDTDCASFSIASGGRLLVRSQAKSELRVYEFVQPGAPEPEAGTAAPQPRGEASTKPRSVLPVEF